MCRYNKVKNVLLHCVKPGLLLVRYLSLSICVCCVSDRMISSKNMVTHSEIIIVNNVYVFVSVINGSLPSLQLPVSSAHDTPQAIFTSFKLPKSSPPPHGPLGVAIGPHSMTPLGHLAQMGRETSPPRLSIPCSTSSSCGNSTCSTTGQPTTPGGTQPILLPLSGPLLSNPLQPQVRTYPTVISAPLYLHPNPIFRNTAAWSVSASRHVSLCTELRLSICVFQFYRISSPFKR